MVQERSPKQYLGVRAINPPSLQFAKRAPTGSDTAFLPGTIWVDTVDLTSFQFSGVSWIALGTGATGGVVTLTGDTGGPISPSAGNINILGTSAQGLSFAGSGSTITGTVADWTTSQKGVGILSSDAQAIAGSGTTQAVTPHALQAKIGTQTAHGVAMGNTGATAALSWSSAGTAGQAFVSGGAAADGDYGITGVVGGGTGLATITIHDLVVGNGTSAMTIITNGTTGQALVAATSGDPAWGTLPVAGGGTGLTTLTAHALYVGNGASAPTALSVGTNGQVLLGSTTADPAFATLTTSTGIAYTTGAHALAINVSNGGYAVVPVAGASQAMVAQTNYIANDSALTTFTLPATGAVGTTIRIVGSSLNTGGWKITYTTNQYIVGPAGSSTATTGNAATGAAGGQSVTLVCTATDLEWTIVGNSGTITLS